MRRRKAAWAAALFGGAVFGFTLCGCAGNGSLALGPQGKASQGHIAASSRMDANGCGHELLYVNADESIQVFNVKPPSTQLCESLGFTSGLVFPRGIFVDSNENLWVADLGDAQILEFARGATSASLILDDPGANPNLVAVDLRGTVYVGDWVQPSIAVYPKGATEPARQIVTPGHPISLSVDQGGDLYVVFGGQGSGDIARYARGMGNPQDLKLDVVGAPIVLDRHGNIATCPAGWGECGIYANRTSQLTFSFGFQESSTGFLTLDKTEKYAWVTGPNDVTEWAYPGTPSETALATIELANGSAPAWVARSPSAPVGRGYRI
jgi:hypothetical protein